MKKTSINIWMRAVIISRQLLYKMKGLITLYQHLQSAHLFALTASQQSICEVLLLLTNIMSRNKSLSLAKLQQSILREYKRVSYGQQTPHYDVESIYYSDLPKELPSSLSQKYKKSIILYNYSFFEMLTFVVLEYLFTCQTNQKKTILEKMKGKICNEDFMFGSNFIKGLLIKGLRSIIDKRDKSNKPIAQILLKNEAMNAFSQFWKEIIQEESNESCVKHTDIPENLAYQYLSNFLGIDFKLLRKCQNQYKEETVASKSRISIQPITLVIFDKNLMESIINKVFQQNIGNEQTERGYILLLTAQHSQKNSILPFSHQKASRVEFDELSQRAKAVTKKGNQLLNKFRQMYREMRESVD